MGSIKRYDNTHIQTNYTIKLLPTHLRIDKNNKSNKI